MLRTFLVALPLIAALGCRKADITDDRYQGMIELERVDLGFELAGRVGALDVHPGNDVAAGARIAVQDDALDREQREIRAREVDVARADLALVAAGSRIEDLRAVKSQIAAARATEQALTHDLARERTLVTSGALAGAHLDDLVAQLARARSQRETLDEKYRLLRKGARSEDISRAEARLALAEQALAFEDTRLEKRVLTTPVAGTVLDTYVDPGEVAGPGTIVATIVDRRRPYADIFVPVHDGPAVRIGAAVAVVIEGGTGEFPGVVERVFPHAEFTPRYIYSPRERPNLMLRVRVRLSDDAGVLHAGLPAYARLVTPRVVAGSR
jgi:HlyD family secretion protein